MITIIDYNMGNVRSVIKAFAFIKADCVLTSNPKEIASARYLVLPGVGTFGDGMKNLKLRGLIDPMIEAVIKRKIPFLGIFSKATWVVSFS